MKYVNYIMLFYFSLGAFIPKGDFSQFTYLPDLIEHYNLHQKEALAVGKTITISEFLYLHFVEGEEHEHEEKNDHENLPLQNISTIVLHHTHHSFEIGFSFQFVQNKLSFCPSFYTKETNFSIFHPPILA